MPRKKGGIGTINMPILSDLTKQISKDYGVLLEDQGVALRLVLGLLGIKNICNSVLLYCFHKVKS